MRILILANNDGGLYKFRRELIISLVESNEVFICLPNGEFILEFQKLGCIFLDCSLLDRHGTNPMLEIKLLSFYNKIVSEINPDIVFTYTIKPNIYGGMVCAQKNIPYVVNITGLGTAVENAGALQKITLMLYKYALRKAKKVFFQNIGNQNFMLEHNIIKGNYDLLPGSGVNVSVHGYKEYPRNTGEIVLLFVGRLMRDKGIEELTEVAKRMQLKKIKLRFIAVGACEDDYSKRLKGLNADKYIEFVGHQNNVDEWFEKAHVLVHPSYHEGMSNVCLEAAACGRPIIASDIPGCRETFDEGISGFGFIPKDVDSLCKAIEKFIALPYAKKVEMGRAGRRKMELEFDRNIVVKKYIETIREIKGEHHVNLSGAVE